MITVALWMEASKDIREKMRVIFQIPKSSFVWVDGQVVKSDGVTQKDLEALTDEKLLEFAGIPGNSYDMFQECIRKLSEIPTDNQITEAIDILKTEKVIVEGDPIVVKSEFACPKCEFIGKNKKALVMHNTKKHK